MKTSYLLVAALASTAAASATAADVSVRDFPACDGYQAPSRSGGDGMSRGAPGVAVLWSNPRTSSQLRRVTPHFGPSGIGVCTALLTHPRLDPEYRLRRSSILQARALHRMASGEAEAALADLDLAEEAATGSDSLAQRSHGVSLQLVRALALVKSGDSAAAAELTRTAVAGRPYEPGMNIAAARLHFAATQDWTAYTTRLRTLAAVDPNLITGLFALALARGEYAEAIELHPQIVLPVPQGRGGYQVVDGDGIIARNMVSRAWLDGGVAYAHEARGDAAAADQALAEAERALEAALAPPPVPEGGRVRQSERRRHQTILQSREEAEGILAEWRRLVRLRRLVRQDEIEVALAEMQRKRIAPDSTALDLFRALVAARPAMESELGPAIGELQTVIYGQIERIMAIGEADLVEHLPEPESPARLPAYDSGGDGFLSFDSNGYRTHRGPSGNVQTIRFASTRGSLAVANEMALLRAAELARRAGRRGMVLVGRRGLVRTMNTTQYGRVISSTPSGQEVEIDVVFVDPDNLPPEYAGARWRVLDAEAIWTALSPVYAAGGGSGRTTPEVRRRAR